MNKNWLKYNPEMDELSEKTLAMLQKAKASTQKFVEVSPGLSQSNYFTRGAHAKSYAYVDAHFSPNQELVDALGISEYFHENQKLNIRFSNANNVIEPGKKNFPAYGMSLKFDQVCYPLVNFPLFPTDDAHSFLELFNDLNEARIAQAKSGWDAVKEIPSLLVSGLKAFYHINPLNIGNLIWKGAQMEQDFLMNYAYHGIGCYRFGDYVGKLHTEKKEFELLENKNSDNLQKTTLQQILDTQEIQFDLYLELGLDEETTPVNILSKEWDQEKAPWQVLGRISIPQQKVIENSYTLENTSYSPFINPKEMQPVGRIQQTRKEIYQISLETRKKLNEKQGERELKLKKD